MSKTKPKSGPSTVVDSAKVIVRKSKNALLYIRAFEAGDPHAASQLIYDRAKEWLAKHPQPSGKMPPRKRRQMKKFKRRRKRSNFMGVSRIPVRRVVVYEASSGSYHRWYFNVKLSTFMHMFADEYQEFKVTRLRVRYVPNNATNETGLYSAVLLDREGFGSFGASTAVSWFPTIGAMPGAQIRPRYQPATMSWKPTEPTARDWYNRTQDVTYATVYICNNGKETDELGGLLEITGTLLARGLYYNAKVKAVMNAAYDAGLYNNVLPTAAKMTVNDDALDSASSRPPSRTSIGGFITIN